MANAPLQPTENERRWFWWAALIVLVVSIVGGLGRELQIYTWKLNHGYHRAEPSLPPEKGFGRYELGNYKLQIPVKYLYTFYEDRGNRWPDDTGPQKVGGGVIFDVFMPDFKPYGPEVHGDENKIREDHVYISLADQAKNPVGYPQDVLIERLSGSYQEISSDLPGFRELHGRHNKQRYYFESPLMDTYFVMTCNGTLCNTRVVYPEYPSLVVLYFFNEKQYLGERSQIHKAIKLLIKHFIVSQFDN